MKNKTTRLIAAAIAMVVIFPALSFSASRPDSKKGAYIRSATIGGLAGALDELDITASGSPNDYDLIDGDAAIVFTSTGVLFYTFDSSSTAAEDDPNYVRPDDYATSGVWIKVPPFDDPLSPSWGGVGADTSAMNGLAKMTNGVVSEAAAGTDYQSDLAVPSEAQAEDRTSSTEYVWTPERIGNAIQDFLADNGLAVEGALAAEPAGEHVGQIVLADNDTWDPSSVTGTTPYWAICTATGTPGTWVAWLSVGGTWLYENIDIATLKASELNDTSDPHLLTDNELGSHYISNSESVGADEWDFPAAAEGWDFCFVKEANQNVTLDPNGTETWYFRTDNSAYTAMSAGEAIVNTTSGKSVLCCFSTDAPDVFCTGDANWAEETP